MRNVTTYLGFAGNCSEAMSFYRDCLGAELELNPYPDPATKIMHARLAVAGVPILMASDTHEPGSLQVGNNFSVAIDCDAVEEADRLFAALSRSGEVRMPLTDAPWGARFGMLTDQFGVQWMINCYVAAGR